MMKEGRRAFLASLPSTLRDQGPNPKGSPPPGTATGKKWGGGVASLLTC